jgi:subtilase family serine protease
MKKIIIVFVFLGSIFLPSFVFASYHFSNFRGKPPIHIYGKASKTPIGITPSQIKKIYNLPENGGHGTIAIIGAYDDNSIEKDLNDFSKQFNLSECTVKNNCLEKHAMSSSIKTNSGWNLETTLDVEWAHAIAPQSKILLVEATTPSGKNFLKAIDYATKRNDVTAVSMSWGGAEFPEEISLDSHFQNTNIAFFASSGDNGTGASWPASSPYVVGVGGTTLSLDSKGNVKKETAWNGSGGGISAYEKEPSYQSDYSIAKNNGYRAIPDVAYDADPASGFPIIRNGVWRTVGGTSDGAPQWAAISTLGSGATNTNFYTDKASSNNNKYFTDITSGTNGDCGYFCDARKHYDYVTGLGTPLTVNF